MTDIHMTASLMAERTLQFHRNWTGLNLHELMEAGRVNHDDIETLKKWVREANEVPTDSTVEQMLEHLRITNLAAGIISTKYANTHKP